MDTPSNKRSKNKSWPELAAAARQAVPPGDIDVRFAVRREIEMGAVGAAPARRGVFADLLALSHRLWFCGLLGGGALAIIPLLMAAVDVYRELIDIARLASPMMFGI